MYTYTVYLAIKVFYMNALCAFKAVSNVQILVLFFNKTPTHTKPDPDPKYGMTILSILSPVSPMMRDEPRTSKLQHSDLRSIFV